MEIINRGKTRFQFGFPHILGSAAIGADGNTKQIREDNQEEDTQSPRNRRGKRPNHKKFNYLIGLCPFDNSLSEIEFLRPTNQPLNIPLKYFLIIDRSIKNNHIKI